MNKTQIWDAAKLLLTNEKIEIDSKMYKSLELLLAPKKAGVNNEFPPKIDEDGNVLEIYCPWIKEYMTTDNFFTKTNSKTGFESISKAGVKIQAGYGKEIKETENKIGNIINALLDEEITNEEAKEQRNEYKAHIEQLKSDREHKIVR